MRLSVLWLGFLYATALCAFTLNSLHQVFCQPVVWAACVLWVLLASPLLGLLRPNPVIQFAMGVTAAVGIGVAFYCLLFIGIGSVIGSIPWVIIVGGVGLSFWKYRRQHFAKFLKCLTAILFISSILLLVFALTVSERDTNSQMVIISASSFLIGFGLLAPVLWGIHFVYMISVACKTAPVGCFSGVALGLGLQIGAVLWASTGFAEARQTLAVYAEDTLNNNWPPAQEPSYFTERIVGRHWRYHTEICLFDGWRPALHDPFVVLFAGQNDPLGSYQLRHRIALYRHLFPGYPVRPDCGCAMHGGVWRYHGVAYLEDSLMN